LEIVNELIIGEWDVQLLHETFWPEDVTEILRIPIDDQEDWPAWHFDAKGLFYVKSARWHWQTEMQVLAAVLLDLMSLAPGDVSLNGTRFGC